MPTRLRIASFNLENLGDETTEVNGVRRDRSKPTLAERRALMLPQLLRIDADVLCLQEAHGQDEPGGRRSLRPLDDLLAGTPYADPAQFHRVTTLLADGSKVYDKRNLVVLSRFPVAERRQIGDSQAGMPAYRRVTANPPDAAAVSVGWERPILYVRLNLPGGRALHVVNLHLKSKNPVDIPGQKQQAPDGNYEVWSSAAGYAEGLFISSMKRVGQALGVRRFLDGLFQTDPAALIAVCGDLNAEADEVPVRAIRGDVEDTENPALAARVLLACEFSVPEPARYSLIHRGRGEMIDHVLASRALLAFYRGTEIHNELIHDESIAFAHDRKYPESDHAPVVASFLLPDA